MEDCVFCDWMMLRENGILYEDEHCLVILDKYPISEGHTLVIPKRHFANMLEAPPEVVSSTFNAARNMGIKIMQELKAPGMNITTNIGKAAGQAISHFHVHVIPRYEGHQNPDKKYVFDHNEPLSGELRKKLTKALKLE